MAMVYTLITTAQEWVQVRQAPTLLAGPASRPARAAGGCCCCIAAASLARPVLL